MKKPMAITLGDPAGIGPEIIAKSFRDAPQEMHGCFVVGDVATMRRASGLISQGHIRLPVATLETPMEALRAPPRCVPVLQVGEPRPLAAFGVITADAGNLAAECVVWAAKAALRQEISAFVTAPLHKEALALANKPHSCYPGHTEMLQALAAAHVDVPLSDMPVRMMLANDELRVVLVSIHMSLREAIEALTFDNLLQTLRITHRSIQTILGRAPRIGVAGLNPHAGEGGMFGREEIDIISPAIAAARSQGMNVNGPFAPDTVFMRARSQPGKPSAFDVVIAMYHDQGLIPVKYLGVDKGVNVTLGLPMVRTSPDHGTAFDIAGLGVADPSSLISAVRVARQISTLTKKL